MFKSICKTIAFFLFTSLLFCSCELIELTQENALRVSASGSSSSLYFTARNLSGRDLNNVRWHVSVVSEDQESLGSYRGTLRNLGNGLSLSESISFNACPCSRAHCAFITLKWESKRGRTCYEWCTVYL